MKFPNLERITVYGFSQYIVQKGLPDIKLLREAGLSRIHVAGPKVKNNNLQMRFNLSKSPASG